MFQNPKTLSPALIFANGAECSDEIIHYFISQKPLIVVLDSAIERVLKKNITPDILIGDFDRNFNAETYKKHFPNIQIIHIADQNSTDLEKAFRFLITQNIKSVDVLWATGRRMDHTLNNLTCIARYRTDLTVHFYDDYSHIFLLPNSFEKKYQAHTILSLLPIGEVSGITTQNLKYPLNNEALTLGFRSGSSNSVLNTDTVYISHQSGHLLLMECWD